MHNNSPTSSQKPVSLRHGLLAVSPIAVFLGFYLVVSLIIGDFYRMPISVALVIASIWAVIIHRQYPLTVRIETFSKSAGSTNIIYMIWIFILAGAFASLAKETGSIDATVNLALRFLPPSFIIPGVFVAACFISLSIGTSVGTVVALTPLAVEMAQSSGASLPFMIAVVIGGAFFGDNLSFISDTTIAATRTQGCDMTDKFKANLWIVIPAALITVTIYAILGYNISEVTVVQDVNVWMIIPYIVIIGLAMAGINVTIVLTCGIISSIVLALCFGADIMSLFGFMGSGIDSMGDLIVITLLAAGLLGVIKAAGGIEFILECLSRHISSASGAKMCIVTLVGLVNLCTANNTVAILTVGTMAKSISNKFGIAPRRTASLLDTGSCIMQCLIPYGAQTLLATSLAGISPAAPFAYLYYPWTLAAVLAIFIISGKHGDKALQQ